MVFARCYTAAPLEPTVFRDCPRSGDTGTANVGGAVGYATADYAWRAAYGDLGVFTATNTSASRAILIGGAIQDGRAAAQSLPFASFTDNLILSSATLRLGTLVEILLTGNVVATLATSPVSLNYAGLSTLGVQLTVQGGGVPEIGRVRITAIRLRHKHARHTNVFWTASRADLVK